MMIKYTGKIPLLRIHIHWIRIQAFRWNLIPDQDFFGLTFFTILKYIYFFDSIKHFHAAEEPSSPHKKTSSRSQNEILQFFSCLDPDPDSQSGTGSTDPIEPGSKSDSYPDPTYWWKKNHEMFTDLSGVYSTARSGAEFNHAITRDLVTWHNRALSTENKQHLRATVTLYIFNHERNLTVSNSWMLYPARGMEAFSLVLHLQKRLIVFGLQIFSSFSLIEFILQLL